MFPPWVWCPLSVSAWCARQECDPSPEVVFSVHSVYVSFKQNFPIVYISFKFLLYRFQFSYLLSHSSFVWILIHYSLHYSFIWQVFGGMLSFVRHCLLSVDSAWWREVISLLLHFQTRRLEKTDKEGLLWMHKSKSEGLPFLTASKRHYKCLHFNPVFRSIFSPFTQRPPPS